MGSDAWLQHITDLPEYDISLPDAEDNLQPGVVGSGQSHTASSQSEKSMTFSDDSLDSSEFLRHDLSSQEPEPEARVTVTNHSHARRQCNPLSRPNMWIRNRVLHAAAKVTQQLAPLQRSPPRRKKDDMARPQSITGCSSAIQACALATNESQVRAFLAPHVAGNSRARPTLKHTRSGSTTKI
ncbi:Uu.00g033510.m01.CDS01 [Anthostomella pinea]|uniref:Uu.00g033510.m01.CDS01 n=1 Tax=Anthostomella pinea TaxID=933095 RepID=A0AAI8V402_9PEZI|nr:Uu.00g033510.m01.CDS01 [Anthostomella pinea]